MPVYILLSEMPYDELLRWYAYFDKRPIGWREDFRAYRIMSAFGTKASPEQLFTSIATLKAGEVAADGIKTLKTSTLYHKMLSSVGGDKIDLFGSDSENKT